MLCGRVRYGWLTIGQHSAQNVATDDPDATTLNGGGVKIGEYYDPACPPRPPPAPPLPPPSRRGRHAFAAPAAFAASAFAVTAPAFAVATAAAGRSIGRGTDGRERQHEQPSLRDVPCRERH